MLPLGVVIANEWGGPAQNSLYDPHRSIGGVITLATREQDVLRLRLGANQRHAQHGTKLIGQCRDRYYLDYEVGMRKRSNPDYLRGWRIVVAAVLWAMLSKELVHHVLTEVGRTQYATSGKWSFHEKRELDQVV
jgi:hypothetical protein